MLSPTSPRRSKHTAFFFALLHLEFHPLYLVSCRLLLLLLLLLLLRLLLLVLFPSPLLLLKKNWSRSNGSRRRQDRRSGGDKIRSSFPPRRVGGHQRALELRSERRRVDGVDVLSHGVFFGSKK